MATKAGKLIGLIAAFAVVVCSMRPTPAQDAPFVRNVFVRINKERTAKGLTPCPCNKTLEKAAQGHAEWMARNGKMEHLQPEAKSLEEFKTCNHHPINRAINAGYLGWDDAFWVDQSPTGPSVHPKPAATDCIGEIIAGAWNAGHPATQPQTIVTGWMNSPGHKKEILTGEYQEMGIGVACTPGGKDTFWCVAFGDPGK